MLIDAIFERYHGEYEGNKRLGIVHKFDRNQFLRYVKEEAEIFDFYKTVADALESKDENAAKLELCKYVVEEGYNSGLCDYILHREWTVDSITFPRDELTEEDKRIINGISGEDSETILKLYKKKRKKRAG